MNDIMSYQKVSTYRVNKHIAKKLINEFGHLDIDKITKQDVQKFASRLGETLNPTVVRQNVGVFRSIMEYADDDWIMPRIKFPKKTKPKQEFYSFDEVRNLIRYCTGQDRALVLFLTETGCRIGEALALQPSDIKDNSVKIYKNVYGGVIQDTPKTSHSVRKIALSNRMCYALKEIQSDGQTFLFKSNTKNPLSPQHLTTILQEVCKTAGMEWKGFHAFRRGNITELILNLQMPEKIVGYRAGHESGGMTLGIYTQVREGCDKPWIEKIEKLLWDSI